MEGKFDFSWLEERLAGEEGTISCVLEVLGSGQRFCFREQEVHPSASIIKMALMAYLYELDREGVLPLERRMELPKELAPSAGIIQYLRDVPQMSIRDLLEMMIIVSDNAATNLLIDEAGGLLKVQGYIESLGYTKTRFQRKMMDFEAARRGLQNVTSAEETADLLKRMVEGKLVSPGASREMVKTLSHQRFSDLIPWYLEDLLPEGSIAHKTGGLEHVVHDAAIVLGGKNPFILCLFCSDVEVAKAGRMMQDVGLQAFLTLQL